MRRKAPTARTTAEDRTGHSLALPAELTQARRFGKARSARSTTLLEDYVELIADLLATTGEARTTDIARRLGVSHPTAINAIARLRREALASGESMARKSGNRFREKRHA